MRDSLNMIAISAATALLSAAVGVSYIYVDFSLNRMGASATAIGLNASMPALGWLLATPLLPMVLRRFNPKLILLGLIAVAVVSLFGFPLLPDQGAWLVFRFLFGGSLGMVFRLIEYWISAASPDHHRGRNVGIYAAIFCAGAALGAGVTPGVGTQGWAPILLMLGLLGGAFAVLAAQKSAPPRIQLMPRPLRAFGGPAFIAVVGGLVFGMFEAVPYVLMPVYSLRAGLSEDWAAWTASAFLVGAVLFPVPMGLLADRMPKRSLLALCAGVALVVPAILPTTLAMPEVLLLVMLAWGGFGGSLYTISLAMLADHCRDADLAAANVAFGTLYAAGALAGPLMHGAAMDAWPAQGLMVSAGLLFAVFLGMMAWRPRLARSLP